MVQVLFDQKRVDEVCALLVGALERNEFPFNIAKKPQDMVSEDVRVKRRMYALLMFGTCFYMRGTIRSDYAIRQMIRMHKLHPELFDPEFLSRPEITVEYLFERMRNFIKFRLFEIPRLWLDGFRRLQEDWGGNPLNIFDGVEDSAELYRRMVNIESIPKGKRVPDKLRGFVGVRPKIANMLVYFMLEAGLIKPIKTSSPFDFHNGRALISTGAIILEGEGPFRFEDVTDIGSSIVERYAIEHGVSMEVMSNALWLTSTTLCRRVPGNRTLGRDRNKNKRRGQRHKLGYKPQKRRKQNLRLHVPDWKSLGDIKRHEVTCGRCPLGKTGLCKLNVAAGFFYEGGYFVTQPRTEPLPHLFIEGGLDHHVDKDKKKPVIAVKSKTRYLPVLAGLDIGVSRIKAR